ncbi:MAG: 7-cyano-7-deazaguanine synthase, partial [Pseudomonadota bacterium]
MVLSHAAPRAVVLLSGGLDSATVLAIARAAGFACYCLSFDYGQRHRAELDAAAHLARTLGASEQRVLKLALAQFGGSALTDRAIDIPTHAPLDSLTSNAHSEIPVTYVPARNTVMLS